MSSTTDTDVDARDATPILPAHIEDTIRAIARLHADHDRRASSVERAVCGFRRCRHPIPR